MCVIVHDGNNSTKDIYKKFQRCKTIKNHTPYVEIQIQNISLNVISKYSAYNHICLNIYSLFVSIITRSL